MQARRFLLMALTSASLVALAACGGASSVVPATTSTPSATPLVNTLYTSTDGAYAIKYPATWKAEALTIPSTSGAVSIINTASNNVVLIEPLALHSTASAQTILLSAISNDSFSGSKVDNSTTTQTYPSGTWTVATASTTGLSTTGGATALSVRLYMTEHGGHTVLIITFAPTTTAATDQTMYFDPMLTSFTFLQ